MVKEKRLQGIDNIEQANAWLAQYADRFNAKFAVEARDSEDAHVTWTQGEASLREILSEQEGRTLSKELTISYHNRCLQLEHTGSGRGLRGAKVQIHEHFDGALEIRRQGRNFVYKEIVKPKKQGEIVGSKEINIDSIAHSAKPIAQGCYNSRLFESGKS